MPEAALKPLAGAIFLLCYVAIASDRVDKTKVALFGAAAMLTLGVVSQHEAFGHYEFREEIIRHFVDESVSPEGTVPDALPGGVRSLPGADWNTIFLLIGMMIIVGIMRHTGVFESPRTSAARRHSSATPLTSSSGARRASPSLSSRRTWVRRSPSCWSCSWRPHALCTAGLLQCRRSAEPR